jgi:hypothetical protein
MKKLMFLVLLAVASPVWAQVKLVPKTVASRVDPCAPIGQTMDRRLIYSMKCDNLPGPPPLPRQAEISPPPPEPETHRSGLFGLFDPK